MLLAQQTNDCHHEAKEELKHAQDKYEEKMKKLAEFEDQYRETERFAHCRNELGEVGKDIERLGNEIEETREAHTANKRTSRNVEDH